MKYGMQLLTFDLTFIAARFGQYSSGENSQDYRNEGSSVWWPEITTAVLWNQHVLSLCLITL